MNIYPFVEAEKVAGHSVKRSCELLEGPLTPTGGPGQEEHGLSYDREFR